MRSFRLILFILVLTVIFFCCKKPPEEEYPVKTEMVDGVKVVVNPGYPRDGKIQDLLEEELSIGLEEGQEEYMLNKPRDVKVSDDGTIYVWDFGDVCIKVYDKEGKYLRTVGRKGKGPGEFEFAISMALSSDGRIFVMDSVNRRVSVVDIYGKYLGGFRVEGYHRQIRTDSMNRIYYAKRTDKTAIEELPVTKDLQEVERVVQIFRSEADGGELFCMGSFEGEKNRLRRTGDGGVITTGSEFNIIWEVDREGILYEGLNKEYRINVFDQEGKRILTFGREYEPVMKEWRMGEEVRRKLMPAFDYRRGWVFDDEGNLWISIHSKKEGEVVYDVFSPEGIYLKQVILPHRIYEMKKGKVYVIATTEEGFRVVKRFRMKENVIHPGQ